MDLIMDTQHQNEEKLERKVEEESWQDSNPQRPE